MKFAAILALCLVATALATPLSAKVRSRRQATSSTTSRPSSCPGGPDGLAGTLSQVGNLLGNVLDNLVRLRALNGDGNVLDLVSDLTKQIQKILTDLLGGRSSLSDDDVNKNRGLLETLTTDVVNLLNNLLGGNEANSWLCTPSTGPLGLALTAVVNSLGGLTGSLGLGGSSNGLVTSLLRIVLQLVGALLRALL